LEMVRAGPRGLRSDRDDAGAALGTVLVVGG
jgi:hypothetical protein